MGLFSLGDVGNFWGQIFTLDIWNYLLWEGALMADKTSANVKSGNFWGQIFTLDIWNYLLQRETLMAEKTSANVKSKDLTPKAWLL
jgi:hypothetical protein